MPSQSWQCCVMGAGMCGDDGGVHSNGGGSPGLLLSMALAMKSSEFSGRASIVACSALRSPGNT